MITIKLGVLILNVKLSPMWKQIKTLLTEFISDTVRFRKQD